MSGKADKPKQIAICKRKGKENVENCVFYDFDSKDITEFRTEKYNLTCSQDGGEGGDDGGSASSLTTRQQAAAAAADDDDVSDSALEDARNALDTTVGVGRGEVKKRTDKKQEDSQKRTEKRLQTRNKDKNPEEGNNDARENPEAADNEDTADKKPLEEEEVKMLQGFGSLKKNQENWNKFLALIDKKTEIDAEFKAEFAKPENLGWIPTLPYVEKYID